jgi:hypothetical protein
MLKDMLLSREDMTFDFAGAKFDPVADKDLLGFIVSQILYGEVTGIQVGHWLHVAPDLEAATFLARQATEELAHVRAMLRILELLEVPPKPVHRWVRFLATDFAGATFADHVALEMALGEGFVLMVFYALCDTIASPPITRILEAATRQEERHVAFGEERTRAALASGTPALRRRLLGQALLSLLVLGRFAGTLGRMAPDHPVMKQLPAFVSKTVAVSEVRLSRLGLLDRPLAAISTGRKMALIAEGLGVRLFGRLVPRRRRLLTDTYMADPVVQAASRPRLAVAGSGAAPDAEALVGLEDDHAGL